MAEHGRGMVTNDRARPGRTLRTRVAAAMGDLAGSGGGWRVGLGFLALLVGLLLAINGLNVVNSYVGRDFITAIENKDRGGFVRQAWLYVGVFALSTVAAVFLRFTEERLALRWRDARTRRLLDRYLDGRAYYQIEAAQDGPHALENPDQRISEDVRAFTTTTLSFFLMMLNAVFTIVGFSGVLWSISPTLFVVAVGYAAVGTAATVALGRTLVGLNHTQLDREADFRTGLLHMREHADALALLHREERQKAALHARLDAAVANARRIIGVNRNVGFFTTGYQYLIQIIPALLVAPLFIRGDVAFGVITQSAMAFTMLMGAFSLIVTQFTSISGYAAVVRRLDGLEAAVDGACATETSPIEIVERDDAAVEIERLTLIAPEGEAWVTELNLRLDAGTRLLVAGKPGAAKAALFRAVAGLSCHGRGRITRPGRTRMLFLPEQPYLPETALRDLLTAEGDTCPVGSAGERDLARVLDTLGLTAAVADAGGLDAVRDWQDALGRDERSLLAVARAALARPRFVFMDRVTAGLDPALAHAALDLLTERGVTYWVLGRPEDAGPRFDAVLTLAPGGGWAFGAPGEPDAA